MLCAADGGRGVYEPLKAAFELAYNGNRAPLPIYLHTTWVDKDPERVEELERFAGALAGCKRGGRSEGGRGLRDAAYPGKRQRHT